MYGGTKSPSLLPKYATDYVVHKEVVRQLFLDGFRSYSFDMKKVVFLPIPFYVGSYKFFMVKSALDFVKDLERFHFGEKSFHRNDAQGKVVAHHTLVKVNFEYSNNFDKEEEVHRNACNMTSLNNCLKKKITTTGGKGSTSSTSEQKRQEEEVGQREKEETTQKLLEGARKLLVEEFQREKEEEEATKKGRRRSC